MNHDKAPNAAYSLLNDPAYYGAVILFVALATILPALLGSAWFLLSAQTIALWLLLLVPLRRNRVRPAVIVLTIWVAIQIATIFTLSLLAPNSLELALGDGFRYREALLTWLYAGTALPASWFSQPFQHLLEVLGVTVGALVSGGLVGVWFLMRAVNHLAFGGAMLVQSAGGVAGFMAALQPWALLRIAGYVGLLPFFALPGYTGDWFPWRHSPARRRLFLISGALLLGGLTLEAFLPALWAGWFGPMAGG